MTLLRAAIATSLLTTSSAASAEAPAFARRGSVVVGNDASFVVASGVSRREPYYGLRDQRRNVIALHARGDAFSTDRLSLGGALLLQHDRTTGLGPITEFGLSARVGYVLGGRLFSLWPGVSLGARFEARWSAVASADVRLVTSLTDSILFTIGPRFDAEVGPIEPGRTLSIVAGLSGAGHTDGVKAATRRARFGYRGMRVFDLRVAVASRVQASIPTAGGVTMTRAAAGIDGFLWHGASIGTWVGATSYNAGAARITALVAGARIGQAIIFSGRLWWWPRVGLEISRSHLADADAPRAVLEAIAEAPFVAAIARGAGVTIGPFLAMPLAGSHVRKTSVGFESSMVFWF